MKNFSDYQNVKNDGGFLTINNFTRWLSCISVSSQLFHVFGVNFLSISDFTEMKFWPRDLAAQKRFILFPGGWSKTEKFTKHKWNKWKQVKIKVFCKLWFSIQMCGVFIHFILSDWECDFLKERERERGITIFSSRRCASMYECHQRLK